MSSPREVFAADSAIALRAGREGYVRVTKVLDDFKNFIAKGNVVELAGEFCFLKHCVEAYFLN